MSIPRGTTPTVKCTFNDETLDLTTALKVYITFEQETKIYMFLTEEKP